ncbi:O-antigen ligase family protein [Pontiellaceae bacterium B12219]|nr:O-antigen ligase family protein [Pontiellaceae bacterium B12219]
MTSLLLILLTICSFLFYGVAGQDKSFLLGPVFVLAYAAISAALINRSWKLSGACRQPAGQLQTSGIQVSSFRFPVSTSLWLLFLFWGIFLIPSAVMPFDAKIRILFFGAVIGSYLVWGQELTAFKDNRIVLGCLIFVVMLTALYGLVAHFKSPDSVLWTQRYTEHYDGRLASTYICPNHFAHLMQMLLPFCLALLFIPQAGLYLKILAGYSFLIFLPPLFLSESRAGWLGSIAAVGVVVCLMALRRSKKLFAGLVILVPLLSILLLVGAWNFSETFQRRMTPVVQFLEAQSNGGIGSDSPDFRPQTWLDTIDMISASPITGYGPGTYRYAYPEFRKRFKGVQIVTGHPHNEYLELSAEFGLVGLVLFAVAWLYGAVWVLMKSLRADEVRHAFLGFAFLGTIAGTMVHSFFDFQMHIFPNAMVFALLAALAVGPLMSKKRRTKNAEQKTADFKEPNARHQEPRSPDRNSAGENRAAEPAYRKLSAAVSWLLSIVFLAGFVISVQTMTSSIFREMADRKQQTTPVALVDAEQASTWYSIAVGIDAGNWRAYQGMGRLKHDERRHCLDRTEKVQLAEEERGWYELALANNPKDPESLIGLGRCLLFLNRSTDQLQTTELKAQGLDLLREACRYRKFNDQYWWILGVELRKSGQYAEALSIFQQMETVKRTASSRKNIQWLKKQMALPQERNAVPVSGGSSGESAQSMLNSLDEFGERQADSLDEIFELMEP